MPSPDEYLRERGVKPPKSSAPSAGVSPDEYMESRGAKPAGKAVEPATKKAPSTVEQFRDIAGALPRAILQFGKDALTESGTAFNEQSTVAPKARKRKGETDSEFRRRSRPVTTEMAASGVRTAGRVTHPGRYREESEKGTIVGAVIEDVANLIPFLKGTSRAAGSAAGRAETAGLAKTASAARAVEKAADTPLRPIRAAKAKAGNAAGELYERTATSDGRVGKTLRDLRLDPESRLLRREAIEPAVQEMSEATGAAVARAKAVQQLVPDLDEQRAMQFVGEGEAAALAALRKALPPEQFDRYVADTFRDAATPRAAHLAADVAEGARVDLAERIAEGLRLGRELPGGRADRAAAYVGAKQGRADQLGFDPLPRVVDQAVEPLRRLVPRAERDALAARARADQAAQAAELRTSKVEADAQQRAADAVARAQERGQVRLDRDVERQEERVVARFLDYEKAATRRDAQALARPGRVTTRRVEKAAIRLRDSVRAAKRAQAEADRALDRVAGRAERDAKRARSQTLVRREVQAMREAVAGDLDAERIRLRDAVKDITLPARPTKYLRGSLDRSFKGDIKGVLNPLKDLGDQLAAGAGAHFFAKKGGVSLDVFLEDWNARFRVVESLGSGEDLARVADHAAGYYRRLKQLRVDAKRVRSDGVDDPLRYAGDPDTAIGLRGTIDEAVRALIDERPDPADAGQAALVETVARADEAVAAGDLTGLTGAEKKIAADTLAEQKRRAALEARDISRGEVQSTAAAQRTHARQLGRAEVTAAQTKRLANLETRRLRTLQSARQKGAGTNPPAARQDTPRSLDFEGSSAWTADEIAEWKAGIDADYDRGAFGPKGDPVAEARYRLQRVRAEHQARFDGLDEDALAARFGGEGADIADTLGEQLVDLEFDIPHMDPGALADFADQIKATARDEGRLLTHDEAAFIRSASGPEPAALPPAPPTATAPRLRPVRKFGEGVSVGKAGQRASILENVARSAEARHASLTGKIAHTEANARHSLNAAPARLRPALKRNREAVQILIGQANRLRGQGLHQAANLAERAADELPTTLDALKRSGVDFDHFIHLRLDAKPTSAGPGAGTLPKVRKARSEKRRKGSDSYDRTVRAQAQAEIDEVRVAVARETVEKIRTMPFVGDFPTIDEAKAAGYVAWDAANPFEKSGQITKTTVFVPEHVFDGFRSYFKPPTWDRMLTRFYDPLQQAFKITVLPLSPSWQVGNVFGNALLGTVAAGVDPFTLAANIGKTLKHWRASGPRGQRTLEGLVPRRLLTAGPTHEEFAFLRAPDETLLGGGKVAERVRRAGDKPMRVVKMSYAANQFVDDLGRAAVYLSKIDQGLSPDKALTEALKAMGDFSRMTPFERNVVRRVIPFYAWQRHLTQLAFRLPLEHPLRTAWTLHLADQWGNDPDLAELPSFLRSAIPVGDKLLGTGGLNPFSQVGGVLLDSHSVGRSVSPLLKIPYEAHTGLETFSGQPFSRPPGTGRHNDFGQPVPTAPSLLHQIGELSPQKRLIDSLRGRDRTVRYDTGDPVVTKAGKLTTGGKGPVHGLSRFLGFPLTDRAEAEEMAARAAATREKERKDRERYERRLRASR